MARKILDNAWPKYPGVLDRIRGGAASITPDPHVTVDKIAELLRPQSPVNITLLVYVGGLEGNAFTAAQDGKIMTALPIEDDLATRALRMTHELTHAVHISMGSRETTRLLLRPVWGSSEMSNALTHPVP
jgi:hypothetical protein